MSSSAGSKVEGTQNKGSGVLRALKNYASSYCAIIEGERYEKRQKSKSRFNKGLLDRTTEFGRIDRPVTGRRRAQ